jgi:SAM-dependent methyltransferase
VDKTDPAYAGQKEYTPFFLSLYDGFVLGFMTGVVWQCPKPPIVERYSRLVSHRHLEVGPGTGYFLAKADLAADTAITLLDPNVNVLRHSARRLESMMPHTVEADVLKPLPVDGPFDSVGLNGVLHCLPGPQQAKAAAVRNIASVLTSEGTLFGMTILGSSAEHTARARFFLKQVNRRGTFDNLGDSAEGLRKILEESFRRVDVEVDGSVAHFTAACPAD